jgi:hypothetical protein
MLSDVEESFDEFGRLLLRHALITSMYSQLMSRTQLRSPKGCAARVHDLMRFWFRPSAIPKP